MLTGKSHREFLKSPQVHSFYRVKQSLSQIDSLLASGFNADDNRASSY